MSDRRPSHQSGPRTLPRRWVGVLILAGLFDPVYGIACKILSVFWYPRLPAQVDSFRRNKRGLLLVLGGIEGPSWYNLNMARGILKARYRGAVRRIDWNAGLPFWRSLVNLMSPAHHQQQAEHVSRVILEYRAAHPNAPISILAQSGGCWITLKALERLPESVRVTTAILVAPSVSPDYDIRNAADRCEESLFSFGSMGDYFFLGLGTLLFGTSDRCFSPSAGLVGWHHRHPRFVEVRWHPDWLRLGNLGNHTTSAATNFTSRILRPLIEPR